HRRGRVVDPPYGVQVVGDAVVGERLDQHPDAVVVDRFTHVPRRPHRVAHVVQAVEEGDQVVVAPRIVLRARNLELDAVADAGLGRTLARCGDRRLVIVETDEPRVRPGLGHHDRRRAEAATDVGHAGAGLELFARA